MNSISPTSLEMAEWLIAREAARRKTVRAGRGRRPAPVGQPAAPGPVGDVCGKLRVTLTVFIGAAGYRSLLMRAVSMAQIDEASLAEVCVLADGSLSWPEGGDAGPSGRAPSAAGARVLVAQLLELLVIFVGRPPTLQLVRIAWPDLPAFAVPVRLKEKQ